MTSPAQILANQANAQLSTGPRSDEGKAAASRNAVRHGLTARQFVILPGEEDEFREFYDNLEADVQPASPLEQELFLQLAHATWTLRRCRIAEATLAASGVDPLLDDTNEAKLHRIDTYIRRAQAALTRVLKELRTLQTERTYRFERQPPCDYPNEEETMRAAGCLIDSGSIEGHLREELRGDDMATKAENRLFENALLRDLNMPFKKTNPM